MIGQRRRRGRARPDYPAWFRLYDADGRSGREAPEILDGNGRVIMPGGMNAVVLARETLRRDRWPKVLLTTGYAEASLERTEAGGSEFDMLNEPYRRPV